MFGGGRGQVIGVEIETGAQGVFTQASGRDITFGADHGAQRLAFRGLRQSGDLPTNTFEWQLGCCRGNA